MTCRILHSSRHGSLISKALRTSVQQNTRFRSLRVSALSISLTRCTQVHEPTILIQPFQGQQARSSLSRKSFAARARHFSSYRALWRPVEEVKKPILQQTKDLRVQLRDRIAKNLVHENIYTLPNILTFSRLVATPVIGYLIIHDSHAWATGLLFYAGVTDLIDGWIARKWNQQTVVGTVIDPLADKALMAVLTVCLAVQGGLPVWLATLILGRDVSLAIAAIYYRYASLPPPKTLARYWNFSLPSAEVYPTGVSKFNTFLQLLLLGTTTALPIAGPVVDTFLQDLSSGNLHMAGAMTAAQILVAGTTIWSGASYLWTKNAVKILGPDSEDRKKRILVNGRLIIGASFVSVGGLALWLES